MTNPLPQSALLAVSLAALACGAPAVSEPPSSPGAAQAVQPCREGDPRAALLAADDLLARRVAVRGYARGLVSMLAGQAVYLHDGQEILSGRRAVRDFLTTVPDAASTLFHRVAAGASADGERGYSFGWIEMPDAAGATTYGKYIAGWKVDGHAWEIEAFLLMDSLQAPDPAPADSPLLDGYAGAPLGGHHLRAAAMQADRDFAALSASLTATSGYGPSFVAYADPGAVIFGRRNLYFGKAWVEAIYGTGTIAGEELSWGPVFGRAAESGDLAWTAGNATYRYQDPTVSIVDYSKYLTVWARQPDGSWKWLLDAGNARPAPGP